MAENKISHHEMKFMTSRIYDICQQLYGDEFKVMYPKSKIEFSNWLNEKTGLNENSLLNPIKATVNWYDELERIFNKRKRS
jgi:hypothetical protein